MSLLIVFFYYNSGKHKIVSRESYDPRDFDCGTKKTVMPKKESYSCTEPNSFFNETFFCFPDL
jgi:hypothetical protein